MTASTPPAPGYWLASDGNWYPPETATALTPGDPKRSRRWPWVVAVIAVLGVIGAATGKPKEKAGSPPESTTTTVVAAAPVTTDAPVTTIATTIPQTTAAPTSAPLDEQTAAILHVMWDMKTPTEQAEVCDEMSALGVDMASTMILSGISTAQVDVGELRKWVAETIDDC